MGFIPIIPDTERLPQSRRWANSPNSKQCKTNVIFADNLKNGRFHQHLRDTFAPLVVRYVDLMESSIAQSIHKGFEKERWEIKGYMKKKSTLLFSGI